jgi:hypothetical protein
MADADDWRRFGSWFERFLHQRRPGSLAAPLVQQYNATFERQIGLKTAVRSSYLGTTSHGLIGGIDLNEIAPSNTPWDTTTDDNSTACSVDDGDCVPSPEDYARLPYPELGDYLLTYGNYGHSQANIFQTQVERRYNNGLMFNTSYTYSDQKSSGIDQGNSSLGGVPYRSLGTVSFFTGCMTCRSGWIIQVAGRCDRRMADDIPNVCQKRHCLHPVLGDLRQLRQNLRFVGPGNIASTSVDAPGDFNDFIGYRPLVVGDYKYHVADQIFDPSAFAPPPIGADVFTNPAVARNNLLWGPGGWGVNFGFHKDFRFGERVTATLGADLQYFQPSNTDAQPGFRGQRFRLPRGIRLSDWSGYFDADIGRCESELGFCPSVLNVSAGGGGQP